MKASPAHCASDARLDDLLLKLKAHGMRVSPQRKAVLQALVITEQHPSAEELHKALLPQFPSLSLATVYKTLNMLKQLGEVLEIEFSSRENRFDAVNPQPHPHLICTRCGQVSDPRMPELSRIIRSLEQEAGFSITSHRLDFFGLCADCAKK